MSYLLKRLSLKWLIFILICVFGISLTFGVQFRNYQTSYANEIKRVEQKHLLVAENLSLAMDRYLNDLAILSEHIWTATNDTINVDELMSNLNILVAGRKDSGEIYFSGNLGGEIKEELRRSESFNNFLNSQADGISFSGIINLDSVQVFALKKIISNKTHFTVMPVTYIREVQNSIQFGLRGHSAIFDQNGAVFAHPNKKLEAAGANLAKVSVVKKMMDGKVGVSFFYSPPMKADMIAGHTVVTRSGWGIMVPQPLEEIVQNVLNDIQSGTYLALFVLLVLLTLGFVGTTILTNSLTQNVSDLQLISEGLEVKKTERSNISKESVALSSAIEKTSKEVRSSKDRMADALAAAKENIERQNNFIDRVNHSIRTPLNGIAGIGQLLNGTALKDELIEYSSLLQRSVTEIVQVLETRFDASEISKQDQERLS